MKTLPHWRLAATISIVIVAATLIALPALSVLRFPLGFGFFAISAFTLALAIVAIIWLDYCHKIDVNAAKKDKIGLIKTIPLIFFTLDKRMQLTRLSSNRFDEFFYGKNFGAGTDFISIVSFINDIELRQQAVDYVGLMLAQGETTNQCVNPLERINPLECVSALMLNSDGRPELRYFKFAFGGYFEQGAFAGVLVAINDISDVINAQTQLQALAHKSDQSAQSNVDLMVRLIKLDRKELQEKLNSFENLLDEANLELKDSGHSGVRYQTLADQVRKKIKQLKNDAAALGLMELSSGASEMAVELELLTQKSDLSGNDFFSVALKLDVLYDCLHKLTALLRQLPEATLTTNLPTNLPTTPPIDAAAATTAQQLPANEQLLQASGQSAPASPLADADKGSADSYAAPDGEILEPPSPTKDADIEAPDYSAGLVKDQRHNSTSDHSPSDAITQSDTNFRVPSTTPAKPQIAILSTQAKRFEFALIQQACLRTAEKLGKKVAVVAQNLATESIPDRLKQPLTEILVQLIRSSLANGLELPAVRVAAAKDETGTLAITWSELANGGYELLFRDDGYGLNFDVIRARALALNRLTTAQAQALESKQLVGFIFEPGFSSSVKAGDNSGFGIGLDLVMAAVKRSGGKISVGTQPGLYTQFRVSFPALDRHSELS